LGAQARIETGEDGDARVVVTGSSTSQERVSFQSGQGAEVTDSYLEGTITGTPGSTLSHLINLATGRMGAASEAGVAAILMYGESEDGSALPLISIAATDVAASVVQDSATIVVEPTEIRFTRDTNTQVAIGENYLKLPVKTTAGDPASPAEGWMYVNTNSRALRLYANAGWRTVASW